MENKTQSVKLLDSYFVNQNIVHFHVEATFHCVFDFSKDSINIA